MKVVNEFPPNYKNIAATFGDVIEQSEPIFCYGDTIYNPFKRDVTPDLEAHEAVHSKQQAQFTTPEIWWSKYLMDVEFRLSQEIEAYGTQYAFIKKMKLNGKLTDWFKEKFAQALSSDLYGGIIGYKQAESKIRHYAKGVLKS